MYVKYSSNLLSCLYGGSSLFYALKTLENERCLKQVIFRHAYVLLGFKSLLEAVLKGLGGSENKRLYLKQRRMENDNKL